MTRDSDSWSSSFRTALLWSCLALLPAPPMQAAFYQVDDTGDDGINNGTCNLREAIQAASTNLAVDGCPAGSGTFVDYIEVPAGIYAIDLTSAGSDLDVNGPITIRGASSEFTIIEASGGSAVDRLIDVDLGIGGGSVIIEDLALRGGNAGAAFGGNLRVAANVDLALVDVEISGGAAASGGGIFSSGNLTLTGDASAETRPRRDPAAPAVASPAAAVCSHSKVSRSPEIKRTVMAAASTRTASWASLSLTRS